MLKMQKLLLGTAVFLIVLGIVGYGIYVFTPILSQPKIHVSSPAQGEVMEGTELIVRGSVQNINKLQINNVPVDISKSGSFETKIAIWEGSTILTFTGTDRFGRSTTVTRIVGAR